jgi:hypothetical protein
MLANATLDWHHGVAIALIASNALAGVWCLGAHRFVALRGWPLWITVGLAQATTFVQAGTGAWLMARDDIDPPQLHALYGFSAIIAVGILYSYRTSSFMKGKKYLLYSVGSLFIMGLGLRELLALSR